MKSLPEVSVNDLLLWDDERSKCCSYLNKKTSKTSMLSKGKWQKRWFCINIDIGERENYRLAYYYTPEETVPRQTYELANASIRISGGNQFILILQDQSNLSLGCDDSELLKAWIDTLENVINVANVRDKMLQQVTDLDYIDDVKYKKHSYDQDGTPMNNNEDYTNSHSRTSPGKPKNHSRTCPALRFDIDSNTIPPTSNKRHIFAEHFINDLSKTLNISTETIEVISIRPAPGMDWLTMVEFDIKPIIEIYGDEDEELLEQIQDEYLELRAKILWTLHQLVIDSTSSLYNGFVTSKLDPSYSINLIEKDENEDDIIPYSTDPEVLRIMEHYKDIRVPSDHVDLTHFTIELCFENKIKSIKIPNPLILRKRCCALWPFEVKQALGFMGNMQELWIEPIALIPKGMPKLLSQPIYFESSVRANGEMLINASKLKADQSYEVECEDKREEALDSLLPEEMEKIKETFNKCDINGDGGISRLEMTELVRNRIHRRKEIIEQKFKVYISDSDISPNEIKSAEMSKAMLMQSLLETQSKLLKMFEAADVNGDGIISFTEFVMAEAWWLRCTVNPNRAHLF